MQQTHRNRIIAMPLDRFLAALIDCIPLLLTRIPYLGPVFWILCLVYLLFRDSFSVLGGRSIGKKIMKIRVIDELSNTSISGRYDICLLRNISLLIPIFNIIDAIMVFSDDRKRFGDRWAKTIVIKN